jgi:hypothetical protein
MPKPISPLVKTLFSQDKDMRLSHFLQSVPSLSFSDKGLENIARRFGFTIEHLTQLIAEFEKGCSDE